MEGTRAVSEALDAGVEPLFAVVSPSLESGASGRDLAARLAALCETAFVDDATLGDLADTDHPQGVLLVCRQPRPDEALPDEGRVLVLDAIQDPGNLGTLVRSAVAFAVDAVLCLDGSVDPWSPKAVRASAGTAFRVPIASAPLEEALGMLRDRGADVLAAGAEGQPPGEVFRRASTLSALIIGNEGAGVRPALRAIARAVVAVPMAGPAESLNAGVAGSILMYEWTR